MRPFARLFAAAAAAATLAAFAADAPYPEVARAKPDLEAALKTAAATNKRVLVDFGGNWCPDCKVLDINMKKPENAALLASRYVVVHVNVGDKGVTDNFDVAERYGVPLKKGVPALAVLDANGKVVFAHRNGEFESMRRMDPKAVHDFLEQWSR